ncbi:competence protein CoiA family protein [Micromonospora chersina]|uniref:competence protein CoiA family protein n=1 Tax=Micromonospora chersina TaxID=47854 RepID=UPI003717346B
MWKVQPPPLACDDCGNTMYAKVARTGLRFFAHAPGAPTCAWGQESEAHHLLKLQLAQAARDAGAHAELEVRSPSGAWRADVLASGSGGAEKFALEAQLASITAADIVARTERMRAEGISCCWFTNRPRPPWLGAVPSVRLASADGGGQAVVEGLVRFNSGGWDSARMPLTRFLELMFTGRVIPHVPQLPLRSLAVVWTAPHYVRAEVDFLAEAKRRRHREDAREDAREAAWQRAQERRRAVSRKTNAASRANVLRAAVDAETAARSDPMAATLRERIAGQPELATAITLLKGAHGIQASVGWSTGDPRYAGGVLLVDENGFPAAVFEPDPQRVRREAVVLLAGMLLLFANQHNQRMFEFATARLKRMPASGYRMHFLDGRPCD